MLNESQEWYYKLIPLIAILVVWEIGIGVYEIIPPFLTPPPTELFEAAIDLAQNEGFYSHIYVTLYRIVIAGFLASIIGAIAGLIMGWSRVTNMVLFPLVSVAYPLPTIALLPLIMIILGQGDAAWIFITIWGANFSILFTTKRGVSTIGDLYLEVAKDYGANSSYRYFKEVLVPGALPSLFTGLRLTLNTALVIVIAIEYIAASEGIGYFLYLSWQTLATDQMYVIVLFIGVLGVLITYSLELLSSYLIPWQDQTVDAAR